MDNVLYGLKRAFHSTLRITRRDFKAIGCTPARMDILHVLYNEGRGWEQPMWQSILRRIIGYTARSTMTEMMQALEALGWIRRRKSQQDKRQREVEITSAGRQQLWLAYRRFPPGWTHEAPLLAKDWPPPDDEELSAWEGYVDQMVELDEVLSKVRFALRDTGCVPYPWFSD
jgi:DNA-binding MarR family transcriptional regulator